MKTVLEVRTELAGLAMQALIGRELCGNALGERHVNHAYVRDNADPKITAKRAVEYADELTRALGYLPVK